MNLGRLFVVTLAAVLVALGIPERPRHEDADEMFQRIMGDCKYMTEVGTVGGAETLEDFEP